ncbi:MAG: zinc ribbon domain-containing protein [Clostridiales bacterium]|jgi:putative FmdB family regulatory protein|nr:zinc ribbon domain-containing protein [Clostridiales bacterium]
MPFYDFKCRRCDTVFNVQATIEEKEKNLIPCPGCGGRVLERVYTKANISLVSRKAYMTEPSPACKCCKRDCPNAQG